MGAAGLGGQHDPGQRQGGAIFVLANQALHHPVAGAGRLALNGADLHPREQGRILGDGGVDQPLVIGQVAAQQGAVALGHGALAELVGDRGVDGLVSGHHHEARGAKVEAMHQGATGEILHQPIVHRVEVLRILAGEAEQAARLVDQQQMGILMEDVDLGRTGRGDKGIDDDRHRGTAGWKRGAIIPEPAVGGESPCAGGVHPAKFGGKYLITWA
ncbi:hypothetical protein D3C72_1616820 [compost metagenome]